MSTVGTAADNAMMESFWGRLEVELLNRRPWKTRIELATGIHDYIAFHNTRRRHASPGMLTPSDVEALWTASGNRAGVQPLLARTAATAQVGGSATPGLSALQAGVHEREEDLQINNDQAA
jgi:hypothetical protein